MHFKTPSRRQYDMRMCNYHDYYKKNNSPKNRYEKVQTTTLGFFIHTYENKKVNKWSVISTPICNAYMYHCDVYRYDNITLIPLVDYVIVSMMCITMISFKKSLNNPY